MFEPTFSEARRVGAPRDSCEPREAGRANTLTIFFEISSNFSKNEHKKPHKFNKNLGFTNYSYHFIKDL